MSKIISTVKKTCIYKQINKYRKYIIWKIDVHKRRKIKFKKIAELEKENDIDFGGLILNVKKLGMKKDTSHGYEASSDMPRVLKKIDVKNTDAIIDLGCGKGYAMYLFTQLPFCSIDGLELNKDLLEIAEKNMNKLFPKDERFNYFHTNVLDFDKFDNYTYFYLYNPFPEKVTLEVFERIKKSIKYNPRKVFVIYQNPQYGKSLIDSGAFKGLFFIDNTAVYESI